MKMAIDARRKAGFVGLYLFDYCLIWAAGSAVRLPLITNMLLFQHEVQHHLLQRRS